MKLLVFSDVHGNLPALKGMLEDAGPVDGYICLGDTVNYGPWSNECVDLISSLPNLVSIEGNHEADFIKGAYSGSNPIAKAFFDFCYPKFNEFEKIKGLSQEYTLNDFTFRHTLGDRYIYPDTQIKLDANYVIGHSHHQFKIESPPFVLYNPGSVGQDRANINVANYIILETDLMKFTFKSFTYDVDAVISEMKKQGYPDACLDYYLGKNRRPD